MCVSAIIIRMRRIGMRVGRVVVSFAENFGRDDVV